MSKNRKTNPTTFKEDSSFGIKRKTNLSLYNKKQFLLMLRAINCNANKEGVLDSRFRTANAVEAKSYINSQAKQCQSRLNFVMGENKNSVFLNLNGCAKNIYNLTDIVANDNALPVTLEAIAQLEEHPPTEQLNGINLKLIYRYLANLMAGYPVEDLKNDSSKRFLESCFKELMAGANQVALSTFKEVMVEEDKQTQPVYSWICNSDYNQYLTSVFSDSFEGE